MQVVSFFVKQSLYRFLSAGNNQYTWKFVETGNDIK